MRPGTFLSATLATMVGCSLSAQADPIELDAWCAQAKQPSSIAPCSDPELRELAIERNHAFEAARARLSPEAYIALLRDQKGWVRSYSSACGINEIEPPALPLTTEILLCLKRAGQARVEYLWKYVGVNPMIAQPKPADQLTPSVSPRTAQIRPPYAACADADLGCKSMRLRQSMTEQEVMAAIGYRPNKVEMQTCGSSTNHPWSCKIFTFGSLYENIKVLLEEDPLGNWTVNSWTVFP
jgi:uncharacterized protein YecT (DUF1311 family)